MNHSTPPSNFHLTFTGSDLAVRTALLEMMRKLADFNLTKEENGTVELVLAEVMNNIVEHAYKDNLNGRIELQVSLQQNGLNFTLCDTGHPMPEGEIPIGRRMLLDSELDAMPEGGFGWFLIRDLARDLHYQRHDSKNELTFRISVGVPPLA